MITFVIVPIIILFYVVVAPAVGKRLKRNSADSTWIVYKDEPLNQKAS